MRELQSLSFLLAFALSGCLLGGGTDQPSSDHRAGGGVGTTNGDLVGRVKLADASPAEGVQVRLFNIRLGDSGDIFAAEWAGLSDSSGRFGFSHVPPGRHALSATHTGAGTLAILPRLAKDTVGFLAFDGLLLPWVTLTGRVFASDSGAKTPIRVCIPGLRECVSPGSDSVFTYPRAPQGKFDLLFLHGGVAFYLPVSVQAEGGEKLFLKDVRLDTGAPATQGFAFYASTLRKSVYILPHPYTRAARPAWYDGKDFGGIRYFMATEKDQFTQWDVEDYLDWRHVRILDMPLYTPSAADGPSLRNFPHYLRLTSAEIDFSQVKSGGADLRVSRGDGTHLPYSIERWDSAAGLAEIWVDIDRLDPGSPTQRFAVRWGNPDATDRSSPEAALGPVPHARQLWSFDDNSTSSLVADRGGHHPGYFTRLGLGKDATRNHAGTGMVGGSLKLDGSSDLITIDPHPALDHPRMTLALWARNTAASLKAQQYIVLKGDSGRKQWHLALDPTLRLRFGLGKPDGRWSGAWVSRDPVPSIDAWHHYAATFEEGKVRVFLDGVEMPAGKPNGTLPKMIPALNAPIYLGRGFLATEQFWSGEVDNLSLEGAVRSPDWIRLLYQTQKNQTP